MEWKKVKHKNTGEKLIFYKLVEKGEIKLHPEDPQHDRPYIATYALCQNQNGEIGYYEPTSLIFIKE